MDCFFHSPLLVPVGLCAVVFCQGVLLGMGLPLRRRHWNANGRGSTEQGAGSGERGGKSCE